jgi:hypothetical protein
MPLLSGRRAQACVLGAVAAAIFIVIALELESADGLFNPPIQQLLVHLLSELGIAGLVAVLLAVTFERLSAEEFRKLGEDQLSVSAERFKEMAEEERGHVKTDVFHYVLGYAIPKEITDEIDTQILKAWFLRRHFELRLRIRPVQDSETGHRYMRLTGRYRYELENLTAEPKEYAFVPNLQRACASRALGPEVRFTGVRIEGCENALAWGEDELESRRIEHPTHVRVRIEPGELPIIPPKSSRSTVVDIRYESIAQFDCGQYYMIFSHHTTDVQVIVDAVDAGVLVFGHTTSQHGLNETHWSDAANHLYHWETRRPFLASQGIYLTWRDMGSKPTELVQLGSDFKLAPHT